MHPDKMSIPCTCPHRDWLMYILYSCDSEFMCQVIRSAAANIDAEHECPDVSDALRPFLPSRDDCLHTLRAKLLVLLDQDEATRRRLCEFTSPAVRNYSPVPPVKADLFYAELHGSLIPNWIKDESVSGGDFVDRARMAYLIS